MGRLQSKKLSHSDSRRLGKSCKWKSVDNCTLNSTLVPDFPSLMDKFLFVLLSAIFFVFFLRFLNATDTMTFSESLSDGRTLVSADGSFELGFFTPGSNSSSRYVGIWYKNIPIRTVVWVANPQNPISGFSGSLMIDKKGDLVLLSKNSNVVWLTNSTKQAQTPIAQLLDSGNLVLRDEKDVNHQNHLWQSFDYPTDTQLPGMKVGVYLKTGLDRRLTAWKNWDDPSPGDFLWKIEPHNNPEFTMWKGSSIYFRSGPWNGIKFSGGAQLRPNSVFNFDLVHNKEEIYYAYYQTDKPSVTRLVMNQTTGWLERYTWNKATQSWELYTYLPVDYCDKFNFCGAYANCIISEPPVCQCLQGFKPKVLEKWNSADWSQGCVHNRSLDCQGDGFFKFNDLKLPHTTYSWINESMDLNQCRAKCLQNCSCTAYSNIDVRNGGSGCAIWFHDLIDIREMPSERTNIYNQDLYVRLSASELAEIEGAKTAPAKKTIVITTIAVTVVAVVLTIGYYFHRIRKRRIQNKTEFDNKNDDPEENLDLPLFDFNTISNATSEFAHTNKLGEGGFGPVYKGTLSDGQEIAVKRLSRNSGQGLEQFKNEVILIAKLQHRNLVKLLGCCIQGEERLLLYEYMPNKSMDSFIFDQRRAKLLDWPKRFNIICGIARGLLYLHQDSRLRIIHRDLKASNVLLDNEMNPKISDFGAARFIGGDQTEGNTNRVVGTYGYMAPEYATDGLFSVKSDVFSFGVIMLEMITGRRSRGFYHPRHSTNLIGYAWRQWKVGNYSELVDSFLREPFDLAAVRRCIHISLLCVQHHVEDRPSMASVFLMLSSENYILPQPKEPGFLKDKGPFEVESSSSKTASSTNCEITMSSLEPR